MSEDVESTVEVLRCPSCETVPEEWEESGSGRLGGLRCGNCGYTPRYKTRQEIRGVLADAE